MNLNADVRARLDAHLDAVEKALAEAKCSRERRRGIVDDLEAQITDMLAARGAEPTLADLEAVLTTLDPPEAYGESAGMPRSQPAPGESPVRPPVEVYSGAPATPAAASPIRAPGPQMSRMAVVGFICIVGSIICSAAALASLWTFASTPVAHSSVTLFPPAGVQVNGPERMGTATTASTAWAEPHPAVWREVIIICTLVGPVVFALLGTVLGWLAFGRIRASRGALYGSGLALFDGLFYPLPLGLLLCLIFPLPMIVLLMVAGMITGIWFLVRLIPATAR
jgi:hypothetical protein